MEEIMGQPGGDWVREVVEEESGGLEAAWEDELGAIADGSQAEMDGRGPGRRRIMTVEEFESKLKFMKRDLSPSPTSSDEDVEGTASPSEEGSEVEGKTIVYD